MCKSSPKPTKKPGASVNKTGKNEGIIDDPTPVISFISPEELSHKVTSWVYNDHPSIKPTKYPIVLSHGMGGDRAFLKSFTGIKKWLSESGLEVLQPQVFRYGKIPLRSGLMKEHILEYLEKNNIEKVNIIAHSMGGLDGRYIISELGGHEFISSLTTISTPHYGSTYCDWILEQLNPNEKLELISNYLPFEIGAWDNLTTHYLKNEFNPKYKDHPDVKYYSVAGAVDFSLTNPLSFSGGIITPLEGPNDGLVSVESSKWGTFLGTGIISNSCYGRYM
eukprot:TRINITY_DN3796_c0_g1_i2.p1 TRINITY_DN3796_c0_g1~~TRINITY_DN3796_c0_g1_i2.p1  ORF type:complete len:303 (-),score=59.26 TRINITY_DN3796_c0_g1_i2:134-967(-)